MKTPLELDNSEIVEAVNVHFDVGIKKIEFLPVGESSWLYVASDEAGNKTIVKAQEQLNTAYSEVLELLREKGYIWMPHLTASAAGQVWERVGDLYFSAQQYIGSVSLNHAGSTPDETYLRTVGTMLKDLHSIDFDTTQLSNVAQEKFDSPLVGRAREAVKTIKALNNPSREVRDVQLCFEAQKKQIDQLFINIEEYGAALREQTHDFRLTHGDVHFGNIIEPPDDHLYLVDWDETSIALPEMDLKYFSDEQLASISQGYGHDLLQNRLQIQYYRNLQMIRALWFWPNKLLEAPDTEQAVISANTVEIFSSSQYLIRALTEF